MANVKTSTDANVGMNAQTKERPTKLKYHFPGSHFAYMSFIKRQLKMYTLLDVKLFVVVVVVVPVVVVVVVVVVMFFDGDVVIVVVIVVIVVDCL